MNRRTMHFQRDISRRAFWLGVALLFAFRLFCTRFQMVYTWVGGAPLDDELMFRAAGYITAGEWLGPYDYLTLSKNMFFAVWLAFIHALHLPYLLAGQLLWCLASLAAAMAFAPVLENRLARLGLFALLACAPSSLAAYTLRVYRDNIFPALCLFCFAGLCGYALRCTRRGGWPWLVLCGLGLACGTLDREDGLMFLLPFVAAGTVITVLAVLMTQGLAGKLRRCLALAIPYGILAVGMLTFCTLNYSHYGIFAISDFSSGPFADAIGAMNRVEESEYTNKVSIPTEVREMLYEMDELAPLRYWLEEDGQLQNDFRSPRYDDYTCGSFYWAIRKAAWYEGVYDSAPKAAAYWRSVADGINALCHAGALPAESGKRSGTAPPIRTEHILPTLQEGLHGLIYAATFQGCAPYEELRSIGTPEDVALWEGYLHDRVNVAAVAGSDAPYYSPWQKLAYKGLGMLVWVYRIGVPLLLAAALVIFVKKTPAMLQSKSALLWFILLGLLGMALLRVMMIAFVMVASFDIPTSTMYLATVHPLLLLFGGATVLSAMSKNIQ